MEDSSGLPGRAACPTRALLLAVLLVANLALASVFPVRSPLVRWLALAAVAAVVVPTGRAPRGVRAAALVVAVAWVRGAAGRSEADGPAVVEPPAGPCRVVARVATPPVLRRSPRRPAGAAAAAAQDERETWFETEAPAWQVYVRGDATDLRPGEWVALDGRALRSWQPRNPGLRGGTRRRPPRLRVPHPDAIARVARPAPTPPDGNALTLGGLRDHFTRLLRVLHADERTRGVVLALVLGDRRLLDRGLAETFRETGTYHLLAISGLHVGLLMAVLCRFATPLVARLAILAGFALVAGASASVVRASLMLALPCIARARRRHLRALDALAWTVALVLYVRPQWVGELGFQLSVMAVFAVLTWARPLDEWLAAALTPSAHAEGGATAGVRGRGAAAACRWAARWTRKAVAVSIAASLGTAPILHYYFHTVHPLGIVWTPVVYPVVAWILLHSIITLMLGSVAAVLGAPFAWAAALGVRVLEELLPALAAVPGNTLHLAPPPLALTLVAVALLSASALLPALSPARRRQRRWPCLLIVTGALAVPLLGERAAPADEIWFFDVGAGSAQLVRTAGGEAVLIDVGGSGPAPRIGERVARALRALGVTRLSAVILTHKDADHTNGLFALLDRVPVDVVLVPPHLESFAEGRALRDELGRRSVPVVPVARGAGIRGRGRGRGDWGIEVLHPLEVEGLPLHRDANESSLVLRVRLGRCHALLPGDIEEAGVSRLLSYGAPLDAGLLALPHHGRANRRLGALLDAVRPSRIAVSAHPEPAARSSVERLEHAGLEVGATWRDGALRAVASAGGEWRLEKPFVR